MGWYRVCARHSDYMSGASERCVRVFPTVKRDTSRHPFVLPTSYSTLLREHRTCSTLSQGKSALNAR